MLHAALQAIPFLMLEEVRRKDWMESFAHHIVTLGLMYYRYAGMILSLPVQKLIN